MLTKGEYTENYICFRIISEESIRVIMEAKSERVDNK